jgi:D-aminoacyl-tRNA deacylase
MVTALRLLDEGASASGMAATYEATHHGPLVGLPAFFIEIGYGELPSPPAPAVDLLANVVPRLAVDASDRVAVGVGGGHYVPHFTELSLRRRWAFGHLISRHALEGLERTTFVEACRETPGVEGAVFARAEDRRHPALEGVVPRLREQEAAVREGKANDTPTAGARSASGT